MLVKRLERHRSHQVYKLKDGTKVPGASTIAKIGDSPDALIHWAWQCGMDGMDYRKVRGNAADIGTLAHFMIECHLREVNPDLSNFAQEDIDKAENSFLKFLDFWDSEQLTVIEPEVQLVSEIYHYGGTIDAPSRDRHGAMVLLDWKTSSGIYDTYISQLSAYEQLWNENRSEPIARRAIIRIGKKEKGDVEIRWLSSLNKYFVMFQTQLAHYYARQELK